MQICQLFYMIIQLMLSALHKFLVQKSQVYNNNSFSMSQDFEKHRSSFHIQIRKKAKQKDRLQIRNELQKHLVISYVNELNIEDKPSQTTLEGLISKAYQQQNDIDIKQDLVNLLITVIRFIKQKDENMGFIVTSRLPTILFSISESFPYSRILQKNSKHTIKAEHLMRYILFKIQNFVLEPKIIENVYSRLDKLLTYQYFNNDCIDEVNDVILYFTCYVYNTETIPDFNKKQTLEKIFMLIRTPLKLEKMDMMVENEQQQNKYVKNKQEQQPKIFQNESLKAIDPILSATLGIFRIYLSNPDRSKYLSQELANTIFSIVETAISDCEFHIQEINYRFNKLRVAQLTHAVYIYWALLGPHNISKVLQIWEKFDIITQSRYRHFALYKYILKIAAKLIQCSDAAAETLLHNQKFTDLVRTTQRVNLNEVCEILELFLKYENSQVILKPTIVIMILDIPDVVESIRQRLFRLMLKFYHRKNYKATDPESCIILKKVAQNKFPYVKTHQELGFWMSILSNGYKYPIPVYIRDQVYDLLTDQQKEDVNLRKEGKRGCRW